MKEIYKNNYGVSYYVTNHVNPKYELQLVINNLGIYMSTDEMRNLLKLVRSSYAILENKCNCKNCSQKELSSLWKINTFFEIRLKINNRVLTLLEDLIVGTQFILNMDVVLDEHRIK